ncbi:threonine aldolase family protein [Parapedobacter tibetensis]|uniref:threonine aldolase family protein n=1 Tax=Parapedobacter tibetensis TaxID=2972951 RepID=UPI00214DC517|nr:aminotransferase class I/II-fold pyridoxal phosphate-dependent enzyme [Parapedobacter tibetensis]
MTTFYYFRDDYSEGCHPNILQALQETNLEQQIGYSNDRYSAEAKTLINEQLIGQHADIHFVSGGTQANLIVISAVLKPYEAVISAHTGHINLHEAGAIEATGHRVEAIDTSDGKLDVASITPLLNQVNNVNSVQPKMVYISNTTEMGTIYNKAELTALSDFCRANGLYLFLDGARLPSALTAIGNDLTLNDIAELTDIFYIGGTKNGGLLGEAIVIIHPELKKGFKFSIKQKGALLAKGRILGLQFRELFRANLIFELAAYANDRALEMVPAIENQGYSFMIPPCSNQLFPILPNPIIDELAKNYLFHTWQKIDGQHAAIRLVTSWATPATACDRFIADLKRLTVKYKNEATFH